MEPRLSAVLLHVGGCAKRGYVVVLGSVVLGYVWLEGRFGRHYRWRMAVQVSPTIRRADAATSRSRSDAAAMVAQRHGELRGRRG